jgi:hypothetical protein
MEDSIVKGLLWGLWICIIAAIIGVSVAAACADDKIDFCYLEAESRGHSITLKGHVPWRFDRVMVVGIVSTDAALIEASKLNCKLQ